MPGDALLFSAVAVFSGYALYASLLYLVGGAREREEARRAAERAVVSALLFALAFTIGGLVGQAASIYAKAAGLQSAACLSEFGGGADIYKYIEAGRKALACAAATYRQYFDNLSDTLAWLYGVTTATGIPIITSPYSAGLFQVSLPFSTAATSALAALGAAEAAAYVAQGFLALAPLGALLVAFERTRNWGALLLGAAASLPPSLAGGADALRAFVEPPVLRLEYVDWGGVVKAAGSASAIAVVVTLALGVATAATYAASRAFDEVGAHLSVE
ncbi:MAG: hypothetical protein ACP5HD_10360 [Thermoproteus sp.]